MFSSSSLVSFTLSANIASASFLFDFHMFFRRALSMLRCSITLSLINHLRVCLNFMDDSITFDKKGFAQLQPSRLQSDTANKLQKKNLPLAIHKLLCMQYRAIDRTYKPVAMLSGEAITVKPRARRKARSPVICSADKV